VFAGASAALMLLSPALLSSGTLSGNSEVTALAWPAPETTVTSTVCLPLVLRNFWPPPYPGPVWGTQFHPYQEEDDAVFAEIAAHDLPWLQQAGFTSIRTTVWWRTVEPTNTVPAAYNWSKYDTRLRTFADYRLEPIVKIIVYPAWATRYLCGGGLHPGMEPEWREFVRALAERYSQPPYNVRIWEIGNEVDGETTVDAEDAERSPENGQNQPTWPWGGCWGDMAPEYVAFLRAAYEEIKAVNPRALVTHGGLAYAEFENWFIRDFFANFLDAGGARYIDFVSFHWFPYLQPWPTSGDKARELRSIMAARDVNKPLWLTETYMGSAERGGDNTFIDRTPQQIAFITHELPRTVGTRAVKRVYWYGIWDVPDSFTHVRRGLLTVAHEPKPGLRAFELMAKMTTGLSGERSGIGYEAYRFAQPWAGEETWALWTTDELTRTVTLSISGPSAETLHLEVGDTYTTTRLVTEPIGVQNGQIVLPVRPDTTFVRVHSSP
jgi:hypothetical protein